MWRLEFDWETDRPITWEVRTTLSNWRKKFRFQVTPSDAQLMAIGLVAVQWSILESYIKAIAHGLFQDDAAREKFDQTLVFRHRLRIVRDLIAERVMAPFSEDLIAIIDRIGALALETGQDYPWNMVQRPAGAS